jgi:hypothetical protein
MIVKQKSAPWGRRTAMPVGGEHDAFDQDLPLPLCS